MNASHPSPPAPRPIVISGFATDMTIEGWIRTGAATRAGALLTASDGRRFVVIDALRILGRRNGETDPYGLTGKVESLRDFLKKGAIVSPSGLRLGAAIYDIEMGAVLTPLGSADESGAVPKYSA
jgi:hypothetical protein